jgi:hypothetical protein
MTAEYPFVLQLCPCMPRQRQLQLQPGTLGSTKHVQLTALDCAVSAEHNTHMLKYVQTVRKELPVPAHALQG